MDDYQLYPESEPAPPAVYSARRFNAIFIILVFLLVIMAIGSRKIGLRNLGASDGLDDAMNGDLLTKASYALKYFNSFLPEESTVTPLKVDYNLKIAVQSYWRSVLSHPTPSAIRKLIILEDSGKRKRAILQLDKAAVSKSVKKELRAGLPAEAAMWRDIYLSSAKMDAGKVDGYIQRIKGLNLGWFERLALAGLYDRKGGREAKSWAADERATASSTAVGVMAVFLILTLLLILLGLAGVVLLIVYAVKISRRRSQKGAYPSPIIREMAEHERSFVAGYLLESFVAYMLINLGVQLAIGGALAVVSIGGLKPGGTMMIAVTLFSEILSAGFALLYLAYNIHRGGWSWEILGINRKNIGGDIGWGVAGYASVLPLMLLAVTLSGYIDKVIPTPPNPVVPDILESTGIVSRVMLFVLVSIMAPIFEELFFRGVLLNSLRARWGTAAGIIVSSMLFAFLHPFPLSFMPIFMLGSVFAILTYERASLVPNMIAHSLNNTLIFVVLMLSLG